IGCVTIELCHNLKQHVPQSIPAAPRLPPRRLPRRERRSPHVKVRPGQSSTLDTQFGPRAASVTEFASAIGTGSSLSRSQLDRLFCATGGRSRIADSLLTARAEAGIPIDDTDPDRTVAMLAPELTPVVSGSSREAGALYLLALFAWTPQITSTTVDLVHAAFSAG